MAAKQKKKPKPYRSYNRYGILNPYGDIWTPETFSTEVQARVHVEQFWHGTERRLDRFKIIPVRVTVSAVAMRSGDPTDDQFGKR